MTTTPEPETTTDETTEAEMGEGQRVFWALQRGIDQYYGR